MSHFCPSNVFGVCDLLSYFLILYNILIIIILISLSTFSAIRLEHVELALQLHRQLFLLFHHP